MNVDLIEIDSVNQLCNDIESKFPEGIWLDMEDKEQRKIAKDGVKDVNEIIKKIDRARIDANKAYAEQVNETAEILKSKIMNSANAVIELVDEYEKPIKEQQKADREAKKTQELESKNKYAKFELFTQLEELIGFEYAEKISDLIVEGKLKHTEWKVK